jgi:hypothetical protein
MAMTAHGPNAKWRPRPETSDVRGRADVAVQAPCDPLQQRGDVPLAREQHKLAAILAADPRMLSGTSA